MPPLQIISDGAAVPIERNGSPMTLGRGAEADLQVLDEKVSRVHCSLRPLDDEVVVTDLDSTNGTFVNGRSIDVGRMRPGDRMRVGRTEFNLDRASYGFVLQQRPEGRHYTTIVREIVDELGDELEDPTGL
jgi:pSer/pThr/pTyr-binding forkhead associated (FHA) protein